VVVPFSAQGVSSCASILATSPSCSVGKGPSPTRVKKDLLTPRTASIIVGPTPEPLQAPPATGLDEVTNGYVPWSTSRRVPCAPSNRTLLPSLRAADKIESVSVM